MPLRVTVDLTHGLEGFPHYKTITSYIIGREESFTDEEAVYEYSIFKEDDPTKATTFRHRYNDGAGVCVEKGLAAWNSR